MKFIIHILLLINYIHCQTGNILPTCNKYNCSPINGRCTKGNKCVCLKGYTTIYEKNFGNFECNYEQRTIVKMFLLEMICGFGVGHFYIGNVKFGIIKLIYGSIAFFVICQMTNKHKKTCWNILQLFLGLGWIGLQIVDGVLIAFNFYKDDYGIALRSWKK